MVAAPYLLPLTVVAARTIRAWPNAPRLSAVRSRAVEIRADGIGLIFGAIVAADTRDADGRVALRKGTRLGAEHRGDLGRLIGTEIHLVDIDPGELGQDEAARLLVRALAGPGTRATEPEQGQARVRSTGRGLLRVHAELVRAVNAIAPLLFFTLPDGQIVLEGDDVAGMKSASLSTPLSTLAAVDELVRTTGPGVAVANFAPRRVFVLVTERLQPAARGLVSTAIRRKIAWYGSTVNEVAEVAHERTAALAALRRAFAAGADLVLVSGANPLDPLDPVVVALGGVGGAMLRSGVPAHPGSMVWVGRTERAPVIGIATCAGFGKSTALDLVLARVLAGDDIVRAVEEIGHGGLLEGPGAASRFPPYDRG